MNDDLDTVTEVTETGWFGRLGQSLIGVPIGIILFVASFVVLFWNEGRAVDAITALNAGAQTVLSISADSIDPANEGRLIHIAGPATTGETLSDPVFRVGAGGILRLERKVEMFQWKEIKESKTEKNIGGSETTTTTYRYVKEWVEGTVASSDFKKPEGHTNPALPYRTTLYDAQTVRVGAFTLSREQVGKLHDFKTLVPGGNAAFPDGFRMVGETLYRGPNPDNPALGDLRVSFRVVPAQPITVVAAQSGRGLTAFHGLKDHVIDLVATGVRGADAMFAEAKADENLLTWVLRGAGFLMMLVGLTLVAGPLSWLASLLPFLETLVDAAALLMALMLAMPLTLITIAVAWLAYRPLLGGGLLIAAVVAFIIIRKIAPRRSVSGAIAVS